MPMMNSADCKLLLMTILIGWASSVDASGMTWQPIRESEIQSGALVLFHQTRTQNNHGLEQRAQELSMELACIMDPPFDSERKRVNIQKVLDPAVRVGVKAKYLTLAKCMFDDESALVPSPNQKLKLEIYKLTDHQKPFQAVWKQLILADQLYHCDEAFFVRSKEAANGFQTLLQRTAKCTIQLAADIQDPLQTAFCGCPDSPEYLVRFLDKILNPSYSDNNTLDDLRDLVAHYVFAYHVHSPDKFEEFLDIFSRQMRQVRPEYHNPRSLKILRIFYWNLQRDQPKKCPTLEVMRDDFVDFAMVLDMFAFIQRGLKFSEATSTLKYLPNLYRLMDSDAMATRAIWYLGRGTWSHCEGMNSIINLVSRKIGLRVPGERKIADEDLSQMVNRFRGRMLDGWHNKMRAMVFSKYWERLYQLKRSGFSGRIAIVNRGYILTDGWLQSLFGIFGRDNTVIDRRTDL